MNFYTNTIAAIANLYHRIIGTTQAEYRTLKARLEALEANVIADAEKFKAELEAKERQMFALESKLTTDLSRHLEAKEHQIFALESRLTTDLSKHLEAIKHLAATKRESPNVQGERPELLR